MTAPEVHKALTEVLAAHEYMLGLRGGSICICGFVPAVDPSSLRAQQDCHRTHLASVLADHFTEAVTEARARELREAADDLDPVGADWGDWEFQKWLIDRADRLAARDAAQRAAGAEAALREAENALYTGGYISAIAGDWLRERARRIGGAS